jgi:hypothetical protein
LVISKVDTARSIMTEEELEKNIKIGIPFMDFLNQCTNLLTIFAIFNALIAYALTLKPGASGASYNLALAFYGMSLLVWIQIIIFAFRSNDKTFYYLVFFVFAFTVQIELTLLYIKQHALFFGLLVIAGVYLGVVFGNGYLLNWLFRKWTSRLSVRKQRNVMAIFVLFSAIVVAVVVHFTAPYIRPYSGPFIMRLMPSDSTNASTINL